MMEQSEQILLFVAPYLPHPHLSTNISQTQLDDYGKDFMNEFDVSVYIVPFDSLMLTLEFSLLKG
jgi:hypothetical protein